VAQLGRQVALKRLLLEHRATPDLVARFSREATVLATLNHSSIVTIHDVGTDADGPFLVMEHLDGKDLAKEITDLGRLPLATVLALGTDLLEALRTAHAQGIIHRDLNHLWWRGRRAKRGVPRACRQLTVIRASRLRAGFAEGRWCSAHAGARDAPSTERGGNR